MPPPAQERPYVLSGPLVGVVRDQAFHARSPAAVNVVLKARPRMGTSQVDAARRQLEMPVDETDQPVSEIARKVWSEIGRAVLLEAPRDVHSRILLLGQLDVGIGLVVAQQDVVLRLVLLDQVVLESKGFLVVVDEDVAEGDGFGEQAASLGIGQSFVRKIVADPVAQALGLAYVQDLAVSSDELVNAGRGRQLPSCRLEFIPMWRERHGAFATEPRRVPSSIRSPRRVSDSSARSLVRYVGLVRIDDRKLSQDVIRLAQGS